MKYFDAFSGIGGFALGIQNVIPDAECVGYSEIDKYAINIYKKHFPTHVNFGDISKINPNDLPDFDMLCGGFNCQPFSIAGKRKGFEDTRGTLFFELVRIAKEKQPAYILLENVKNLLSHDNGKTFEIVCESLCEIGYIVDFTVLNSRYFGVSQNRERVFILCIRKDLLDSRLII